jgi:hypothetical protein
MLQTFETVQKPSLQAPESGNEKRIAQGSALAPEFGKRQLRKFSRFGEILGATLEMDGQLFAG